MVDCKGVEYTEIPLKNAEDISDKKFGRLSPSFRVNAIGKNKNHTYWLCDCDCGNEVVVDRINLSRHHTTSCGCFNKEQGLSQLKHYVGEVINGFTFLGRDMNRKTSGGGYYWIVKCPHCGKEYSVSPEVITNNRIESCGCLNISKGELKIKNLLEENNIHYKAQYTFTDLVSSRGGWLKFDFGIYDDDFNLIELVEYDGIQHFMPKDRFGGESDFEILRENDELKNEYCKAHNIPLVRIPYTTKEITIQTILPNINQPIDIN